MRAFAEHVGVPHSSYDSWEKGKREPSAGAMSSIVNATGCNAHWLLTGEGEPMPDSRPKPYKSVREKVISPLSAAERPCKSHGNVADEAGRCLVEGIRSDDLAAELVRIAERVREVARANENDVERLPRERGAHAPPAITVVTARDLDKGEAFDLHNGDAVGKFRALPILEHEIAAGAPRNVYEENIADWAICYAGAVRHPESTSCIWVRGESMAPEIPDGALVAVDHAVRDVREMRVAGPCAPRAAVRDGEGGCVIREVHLYGKQLVCRPANPGPDHPELTFDLSSEQNPVVGQVIWVWYSMVE